MYKFLKFLLLFKFIIVLFFLNSLMQESVVWANDPYVWGEDVIPTDYYVPNSNTRIKTCGSFGSPNADFDCRCEINQCRLSKGRDYMCVKSARNITDADAHVLPIYAVEDNKVVLKNSGKGDPLFLERAKDFLVPGVNDPNGAGYYEVIKNAPGLLERIKVRTYIDMYVFETTRSSVPMGSFCKYEPTSGQAYWFYPGFAQSVTGGSNQFVTSTCSNPLFTSRDLFGNRVEGTTTVFGCLPNSINGFVAFVVRLITGFAFFVSLLIIIINFMQMMSNSTNPNIVKKSQENMQNAIFILLGIILGTVILEIVGIQILGINTGVLNLFTGG